MRQSNLAQKVELLVRALQYECPFLFLGAGFSLKARLRAGSFFPTANQLKMRLLTDCLKLNNRSAEFKELSEYSLDQVCEYIGDTKKLEDYLVDYFKGAKPAEFHYKLACYRWKRIYTVNIDDIVERIYERSGLDLLVQDSRVQSRLRNMNCTELIKLHGSINNPSAGLTFSTAQYVGRLINSRDYRFTSLGVDMHREVFIILGTTLDEIDIDYYLKLYEDAGYSSLRGNFFLVNPHPSMLLERKIERLGGHVIKWTTKKFLNFVSKLPPAGGSLMINP